MSILGAEAIFKSYRARQVVNGVSLQVNSGEVVGLLGPNGAGKTTLLKILLGQLEPQQGRVKVGTKLEVAYFDQHRAQLDQDKTVIDNISDGRSEVTINGKPRHIISYLQDFLFAPERSRQPVRSLSGGERNRLLLAKLFTKPANVLVLDEPTNDLDVETLELLEELLIDYQGTVLLVSHDREFINNVVTGTLVFEGDGVVNEYVGGYDDWLRQRNSDLPQPVARKDKPKQGTKPKPKPAKKLSYKDQRELDLLPQQIETLENELVQIQQSLADPDLYQQQPDKAHELDARMKALEAELSHCYARWEALEALRQAL